MLFVLHVGLPKRVNSCKWTVKRLVIYVPCSVLI